MKIFQSIVILTMTAACLLFAASFTAPATDSALALASTPAKDEVKDEASSHRDVNGDGVIDSMTISDEGGSAYGGSYLTIVDGRSQKTYSADNGDFYGAVVSVCVIDVNEPSFAKAAEESLLPKERRQTLDPLGAWVVSANCEKRILSKNKHFDMVSKPQLVWSDNKSIPSTDYCMKVTAVMASGYLKYRSLHQDEDFAITGVSIPCSSSSAWFVYRGFRFIKEPLREVFRSDNAVIFANNNCVGVEREDGGFAWLFVNDECLFGRTGGAIESMDVQDGVILLGFDGLKGAAIDYKTGKIASLKPYSDCIGDQGNIKPSAIKAFKALIID